MGLDAVNTRLYNNNRKGSKVTRRDTMRVTIRDSEQNSKYQETVNRTDTLAQSTHDGGHSRQDDYIRTQFKNITLGHSRQDIQIKTQLTGQSYYDTVDKTLDSRQDSYAKRQQTGQ